LIEADELNLAKADARSDFTRIDAKGSMESVVEGSWKELGGEGRTNTWLAQICQYGPKTRGN
jgi:hypothetical protein